MLEISDIWGRAHHMLRAARQIINAGLRPLNLTSAEGNILLHLLTQGEAMGQEQLVEQLDISKPAVSRALDSLESKGYITRRRDPADRRAYHVHLSEQARAAGPAIQQIYNRVFSLALRDISPEELALFMNLFGRISNNFARELTQE